MRWIVATLHALVILVSTGCGSEVTIVASSGGGTIVVTTVSSPTISLAQFRQDTAIRTVLGSIDFYTPGSDLGTMTITVTDSHGAVVSRTVIDLVAYSGMTRGSVPFSINYVSFLPGSHGFTIFVTNRAGSLSDPVFGAFSVP